MTGKQITPAIAARAIAGRGLRINLNLPGRLDPAQVKRIWARAKKRAAKKQQAGGAA